MAKNLVKSNSWKIAWEPVCLNRYNPESKLSQESRQKELLKGWALASLLIEGVFLLTFSGNTRSYYGERHRNDPKYFDPLKQKLSDLMDVLDQSKIQNSLLHIWCKKEHQAAPMSSASLKSLWKSTSHRGIWWENSFHHFSFWHQASTSGGAKQTLHPQKYLLHGELELMIAY